VTEIEAVHPRTGEIFEHLDQVPPETLADILAAIRDYEANFKQWGAAVERELRRRLKMLDRTLVVFGEWEVAAPKPGHESVWDVEEFETVLNQLADDGVVKKGETTELIKRTTTVRASEANRLIARLTGESQRALEATRSWREKPKPVTVAKSVELTPPTAEMALSERGHTARDGSALIPETEPTRPSQPPAPTLTNEELFA
jgi:hypothetical protein